MFALVIPVSQADVDQLARSIFQLVSVGLVLYVAGVVFSSKLHGSADDVAEALGKLPRKLARIESIKLGPLEIKLRAVEEVEVKREDDKAA